MDTHGGAIPFGSDQEIRDALPGIVQHLRAQKVIAYPTETVYGFGSSLRREGIARVAHLKGSAPQRPFIALIAGRQMLETLDVTLNAEATAFAARFWPGPLTLVVSNRRGEKTAVRWTPHRGSQQIIRAFGAPISSTSANRSGLPPVTTAAEIVREWEREVRDGVLLVLDGGAPVAGQPSTIVDCTANPPHVIRRGAIEIDALRTIAPRLE